MGNNSKKSNKKSSPWDILQIDEQTKRDTKLWNEDNSFFKSNKKKDSNGKSTKSKSNADSVQEDKVTDVFNKKFNFTGNKIKQQEKLTQSEKNITKDKKDKKNYPKIIFEIIGNYFYRWLNIWRRYKMPNQTKKTWVMMVILTLLILVFSWLISPQSMVQSVKITGNTNLTKLQVVKATGIKMNRSIFGVWLHEKQIEQHALKVNNRIKQLTVRVINPTTVKVSLKEATKVGYILRAGKYYLILDGGQVLDQGVSTANMGVPIYDGFKENAEFRKMIKLFSKLDAPIRESISEIKFKPNKDDHQKIVVYMNDGNQINARSTTFVDKMAYYPSIAAQMDKPGIINLEVGAFSISYDQIKQNKAIEKQKKAQLEAEKKAQEKNKADNDKTEKNK